MHSSWHPWWCCCSSSNSSSDWYWTLSRFVLVSSRCRRRSTIIIIIQRGCLHCFAHQRVPFTDQYRRRKESTRRQVTTSTMREREETDILRIFAPTRTDAPRRTDRGKRSTLFTGGLKNFHFDLKCARVCAFNVRVGNRGREQRKETVTSEHFSVCCE